MKHKSLIIFASISIISGAIVYQFVPDRKFAMFYAVTSYAILITAYYFSFDSKQNGKD